MKIKIETVSKLHVIIFFDIRWYFKIPVLMFGLTLLGWYLCCRNRGVLRFFVILSLSCVIVAFSGL